MCDFCQKLHLLSKNTDLFENTYINGPSRERLRGRAYQERLSGWAYQERLSGLANREGLTRSYKKIALAFYILLDRDMSNYYA